MPELPEVETTCRGIAPHIINKPITAVVIRQYQLRWPIPHDLATNLYQQTVTEVSRRAKYCLLKTNTGTLILHLGMSGNLRIVKTDIAPNAHDHFELIFADNTVLRFNDQRKFGAVLWTSEALELHPLLKDLGPEPLTADFQAEYLYQRLHKRKQAIKSFIMDGHIVVGVGNIYASESLFAAEINPLRAAGSLNFAECEKLVTAIRSVLEKAIAQGGTTLKDFIQADGKPGYFSQSLMVYGRSGLRCFRCQSLIQQQTIAQRASYFCPHCQI